MVPPSVASLSSARALSAAALSASPPPAAPSAAVSAALAVPAVLPVACVGAGRVASAAASPHSALVSAVSADWAGA